MPKFIIKIMPEDKILLNNDDVCCYLADKNSSQEVVAQAVASDKLVLAVGVDAVDFCQGRNLDGVLISREVDEKYAKYIKGLQKETHVLKFWGAEINPSRHEAMLASEAEPDFVAFRVEPGQSAEAAAVLDWYSELFLIQSALFYQKNLSSEFLEKTDFLIINTEDYKILVDKIKRLD